jgi:hypothetical protein
MMFGQATAEITPARWRRPAREHASSNCSHSSHAFRPREAMEPTAPKFHSLVSALSEAHRQETSASLGHFSVEANKRQKFILVRSLSAIAGRGSAAEETRRITRRGFAPGWRTRGSIRLSEWVWPGNYHQSVARPQFVLTD